MNSKVVGLVVALCAAVIVGGCAGGSAGGGDGDAKVGKAGRTLTKDNLPTEIGTTWTTVRSPEGDVAIDLSVSGPWTFSAKPDWASDSYEIVDQATVPDIDLFNNVTFITKVMHPDSPDYYYPRTVTGEWVDHLGTITVTDGSAEAEPLEEPQHFWPLNFEVGQEYEVGENDISVIKATVLARNTATVPAGTIEDVHLVRFEYTMKADGTVSTYYYMFAPDVGFVALIHPSAGNEKDGFTAAEQIDLLATMPTVR